jgi:hypothetical protein
MSQTSILISDDLIFGSRIGGAVRQLGSSLRIVKSVGDALKAVHKETPTCLFLDLAVVGAQLRELLSGLESLPCRPRIVAYGSHVDTEGLRAATEAGCDLVLPRSRFVQLLDQELSQWLSPNHSSRPGQAGR